MPCSPKTYARRLTTLKVFFGWLAESGVIDHDPAAGVAHDRPTTPLPEILYDDSVNALLGTARDLLWAAKPDARPFLLVTLILQTGIKKGECMEIKQEHVDLSNPQAPVLYVRYADPWRTLKERKLALGPTFTAVYRQYLREYQPKELIFECTARNLEYVLGDPPRPRGSKGAPHSNSCAGPARCVIIATGCLPTNCVRSSASPTSPGARPCPRSRSWRDRRCNDRRLATRAAQRQQLTDQRLVGLVGG